MTPLSPLGPHMTYTNLRIQDEYTGIALNCKIRWTDHCLNIALMQDAFGRYCFGGGEEVATAQVVQFEVAHCGAGGYVSRILDRVFPYCFSKLIGRSRYNLPVSKDYCVALQSHGPHVFICTLLLFNFRIGRPLLSI
jgi:hypothetical protein